MIGESVARRSEHLRPSSLASPERQHGQGARSELGKAEANAMAFCSCRPLSRRRPTRRLPCRPPPWPGGGIAASPCVPLIPAALFPFHSGPSWPSSGLRRIVPLPSILLTSTFQESSISVRGVTGGYIHPAAQAVPPAGWCAWSAKDGRVAPFFIIRCI